MIIARVSIILKKIKERFFVELTSIPDFLFFLLRLNRKKKSNHVIFVGVYMHARTARLARWIKRKSKYNCILIAKKSVFTADLSNDEFDQTLLYRNKWHLLSILRSFSSNDNVIHSFGPPHEVAFEIVKRNIDNVGKHKQRVVFDFQDLMITNFGMTPPFSYMRKDLKREEFILKNASGIISHSLELQSAKKYFGAIKTPKLFFPLYVDSEVFEKKIAKKDNELHLVYVGGVHSKFQNSDYFGGQQLYWLVEKLDKQKIHFHIYPTPTNRREDLRDYIKYDRELDYFHLHKPVPQSKLLKEINKYDYGVIPFFHNTNNKLDEKRTYCTTLKLFNYIEAGIPIIIGKDTEFENFIGRRYKASIPFTFNMFDDVRRNLSHINYKSLIINIQKERERYSLKRKIDQMIEFYDKLSENNGK